MSELELAVLRTARVFGPCSNADIARRINYPADKCYRIVKSLELEGLLIHPKLQRWDISELGRDVFRRMPKQIALFNA